ncbi:MAG: HDIG domain-containing protein [Methanolinea sp.]|nr:HDIG domain-containing protein [Methanolinea sp.]
MPDPQADLDSLLRGADCSRRVIEHCHTVRDVASGYDEAGRFVDRDLLLKGAVLHDIGRGQTHSLFHAQAGAEYCRRTGLPEPVARIVERHTGAGLTADECSLLRLLPIDCIPHSLEEKIVANADNLVRGQRRITIDERILRSCPLPRKVRRRIFRLWLEMECFL